MIKPRARESLESGGDGAHSGTRAKAFSNAVALTTPASPHASNGKSKSTSHGGTGIGSTAYRGQK